MVLLLTLPFAVACPSPAFLWQLHLPDEVKETIGDLNLPRCTPDDTICPNKYDGKACEKSRKDGIAAGYAAEEAAEIEKAKGSISSVGSSTVRASSQ